MVLTYGSGLGNCIPALISSPSSDEERAQALRIAALHAVYRNGGAATLYEVLSDKDVMQVKGVNLNLRQLEFFLKAFPDNFMVTEDGNELKDTMAALMSIDVEDTSMLSDIIKRGLLGPRMVMKPAVPKPMPQVTRKASVQAQAVRAPEPPDDRDGDSAPQWKSAPRYDEDQALMEHLHEAIHGALWPAVNAVSRMGDNMSAAAMASKIGKYIFKAAANPELRGMQWQEAAKNLVAYTFQGYTSACSEADWFFQLDLVPALCAAASVLFLARQKKGVRGGCPSRRVLQEVVAMEFEDGLDRNMLDKGMWEAVSATFDHVDDRVKSKIFHAVSRSYWPVLDEVILGIGPDKLLQRGSSANELNHVETFVARWMQTAVGRVWGIDNNPERLFTEEVLTELFLRCIAPFGPDHPYSCIPKVLVETIGTPPSDWNYIQVAVQDMFREWGMGVGESAAKKRKTDATEYGSSTASQRPSGPPRNVQNAFRHVPRSRPAGSVATAVGGAPGVCEAGHGHPGCTSQEDCIGSPQSRLVQHLLAGEEGDIYCEPCWCTFVRRNPSLHGMFLE